MYYVYVLQSLKDNQFYTGYTSDLRKRIKEHFSGYEISTKYRLPFKLIYYEAYLDIRDAKGRELFLKSGSGKRFINKQLKYYLSNQNSTSK